MARLRIAVFILCVALCPAVQGKVKREYAQATPPPRGPYRRVSLEPYFGIAGLTGSFKDVMRPQFIAGAILELPMAGISSIELEAFYQRNEMGRAPFTTGANAFGFGSGIRLTFLEGWFQPYGVGGLLFTQTELTPGLIGFQSEWSISAQIAGGAMARLAPWLRVGVRGALLFPVLNSSAGSGLQFPLSNRDASAANDISYRLMGVVSFGF